MSDEIAIHVERQAGELVNELSRVPAACFIIMRSRSTWIRRCCTQCQIFLRATRRQGRSWCRCLSCNEVKVTLMPSASTFGLRRGVTSTYHWWFRGAVRPRWARNRQELRTTSQRVCLEIPVWHNRHQCDTIESAACPDCNSKWALDFQRRFILQLFWQRRFIREDGLFSLFFVHHHLVVFSPFSTSNRHSQSLGPVISRFFRVPQSTAKNSRSTAINIRSMEINRGSTVCPRFIHGLSMVCQRFRWDVSVWNSWEYERVLKGQTTGAKGQKTVVVQRRFILQSRKSWVGDLKLNMKRGPCSKVCQKNFMIGYFLGGGTGGCFFAVSTWDEVGED